MKHPSKLSLTATAAIDFQAADDGTPKRPTFKIHAYTGAVVNVGGFFTPVIVDLAGLKPSRPKLPILLDHDPSKPVGIAEPTIDASGVYLSGTITGDDDDAQKIVTHAKNGFEWQASIGANIGREEFLKAGEKTTVNNREVTGPLLIARESSLVETSFVAIGADQATSASVAASMPLGSSSEGETTMSFESWLAAEGTDPAAIDENAKRLLRASYDLRQKAGDKEGDGGKETVQTVQASKKSQTFDDIIEAQRKEDDRQARIAELTAEAVRDRPMLLDEIERMGKIALDQNRAAEEFEVALLRLRATAVQPGRRPSSQPHVGSKVLEAAICRSAGLNDVEKHFDDQTMEAVDARFRRGIGLKNLLLIAAKENGHHNISTDDPEELLRGAFTPAGRMIRADGFSSISISGILANTANKFMLEAFNAVESSWREVSAIERANDFKTITSYALTGDLEFKKIAADGEIKHGTLGEESYSNRVDTYARMLAVTYQDIVNDDLGALTRVPRKLGRGGALALNKVFWTAFMDNASFFSSGNSNYIEGATPGSNDSRLGVEGLTRGETAFDALTDPDGNPLGSMARILLVPSPLGVPASVLMTSADIADNTSNAIYGTANPHRGKYRVVKSIYLNSSAITGYSPTAWYLLADPADIPVIETRFLFGRQTPLIERADADFNKLGIQMRGTFHFGVAKQEKRGGLKSKGAA